MSDQPLHPNLARLASAYDAIVERFNRRELTAAQARGEIMALVARDDEGVQWSINPDTAQWQWRSRTGELRTGTPPAYGLATPTAFDLTRNATAFNPDSRINFHTVDESLLHAPSSLSGATRRPQDAAAASPLSQALTFLSTTPGKVVAGVLVLLLILVVYSFAHSSSSTTVAPSPTTSASAHLPTAPPAGGVPSPKK